MDWEKFSAVAIGYAMLYPRLHRVGSHHFHGARESIRQLYRRGYRRIGLCLSKDGNLRLDHSWLQALAYHQLRTPRKNWVKPLVLPSVTDKQMLRWIKEEKPDCILGQFEWIPQAVEKAGYDVPGEIAVSLFSVEYAEPGVAGMDQRFYLTGETACDVVVGQHYRNEKGIPATPHTLMIEGIWTEGRTVARK
jgi:DNA-binding LacI/PurR family transcriptional regulator